MKFFAVSLEFQFTFTKCMVTDDHQWNHHLYDMLPHVILIFWPRDIIKGNPRSYSSFETYFDLYPTGSPLLMVHWCGPSDWPTLTGPLFRQSEATYIGQWKVVLLFFSENIKKSDHQPITKWIIYYLFFRHATPLLTNDKTIPKIIILNLHFR